jgi:ribosome-binding factor A
MRARVYVSVLGSEAEREETLAGLRSSRGYLQAQLGSELKLKRTPTLDFVYDESVDRAMRIERLLAEGAPEPDGTGR